MTKYDCKICGKLFPSPSRLEEHSYAHRSYDERPNKVFFRAYLENSKILQCDFCEKRFATAHKLRRHERIHSPYRKKDSKCLDCGNSFYEKEDLRRHMKERCAVRKMDQKHQDFFTQNESVKTEATCIEHDSDENDSEEEYKIITTTVEKMTLKDDISFPVIDKTGNHLFSVTQKQINENKDLS